MQFVHNGATFNSSRQNSIISKHLGKSGSKLAQFYLSMH